MGTRCQRTIDDYLFWLSYLTDAPYSGRFDPNPMHAAEAAGA
jgi:hypothetical protein